MLSWRGKYGQRGEERESVKCHSLNKVSLNVFLDAGLEEKLYS